MFGDPYLAATAEKTLRNLVMEDSEMISKYIIEFSRWAPYTGWGSIPLGTLFYWGLPNHIKEGFRYMEQPRELIPLQKVASCLDQYHWEVEKDLLVSFWNHPGNSGNSRITSTTISTPPTNFHGQMAPVPAATSKMPESSKAIKCLNPEYVINLDSSGHLTQKTRELCIADGLCLYCGTKGHSIASCLLIPNRKHQNPDGTPKRAAVTILEISPSISEPTVPIPVLECTVPISEVIPGKPDWFQYVFVGPESIPPPQFRSLVCFLYILFSIPGSPNFCSNPCPTFHECPD